MGLTVVIILGGIYTHICNLGNVIGSDLRKRWGWVGGWGEGGSWWNGLHLLTNINFGFCGIFSCGFNARVFSCSNTFYFSCIGDFNTFVQPVIFCLADVNECAENVHNCRPNQICRNTRGHYSCFNNCQTGFDAARNGSCVGKGRGVLKLGVYVSEPRGQSIINGKKMDCQP